MSRVKTLGFETGNLTPGVEVSNKSGNAQVVADANVRSGSFALLVGGPTVSDTSEGDGASFGGSSLGSGGFGGSGGDSEVLTNGFVSVRATTKRGGGYFRVYYRLREMPDGAHTFVAFKRDSDSQNMVGIEVNASGALQVFYRNDAGARTELGAPFSSIQPGAYYDIEFAVIGNETGTNRHIEARVNGINFMAADITDQAAYDGFLTLGFALDADDVAGNGYAYFDDVAINDAFAQNPDGSTSDAVSWPGPGKVVRLNMAGLDESGNNGFARGGTDSGTDYGQVNETSPDDAGSYIASSTNGASIEFTVTNPFSAGIMPEDTIKVVGLDIRWRQANPAELDSSFLDVFLRAGTGLAKQTRTIGVLGDSWLSGAGGAGGIYEQTEVLSLTRLPQIARPWGMDDLAALRAGLQINDATAEATQITSLYLMVEYQPYGDTVDYVVKINGIDRANEVRAGTLSIKDNLNEQVNTCDFQLYDLHGYGAAQTDQEFIIEVNGLRIFAGLVLSSKTDNTGGQSELFSVSCVDWTRRLDQRMVAATFLSTLDKNLFDQVVDQYVVDSEIDTYYVSPFATVNQISANYIPPSSLFQSVAELTGRHWYIDYYKHLRYFPVQQARAPFDILPDGAQYKDLSLKKDASRLRNRIFVRGGTEETTSPFTETLVADGTQRQFILGEKPKDLTVAVNGTPETVGIENIDDPAGFNWLMNFEQKYIVAGTGRATPAASDEITITYIYDVPILVSVEDTASIQSDGVFEYPIIDKSITTSQQARDRATAELTDYARSLVDGGYTTYIPGLRTGMYQRVVKPSMGIDEDYLISKVTATSLGGGTFVYNITLTNAKLLGIIRFMLQLLKTDRRVGDFDPNEKVDQLLSLSDNLDSLQDSLLIDSQGAGFPWAPDSSPPATSLKWDLGQWS